MIPVPPTPPPAAPVAGALRFTIQHAHGNPVFALAGERIVARGVVVPFVAGQKVVVRFYRNARKVEVRQVSVLPVGNGAGQFHIGYTSAGPGLVSVRGEHVASPAMGAFRATSKRVRYISAELPAGGRGPAVRLLQSELNGLRYAVPLDGVFDEATQRAVVAYRKITGLPRVTSTNRQLFSLLQRGAGRFRVRYPGDGEHVEADLSRQVLAEIEPGGRVRRIYTISSGKPSTPTVIGRFRVYMKTPGTNAKGMVDSNYFIRGYAIHGYAEVPTYAASHGCLRVPVPDARTIYGWLRIGDPVDVYYESGGGSHSVRGNAGP